MIVISSVGVKEPAVSQLQALEIDRKIEKEKMWNF